MKSLEQKIIVRCKNCGWRIFDKVTMTTGDDKAKKVRELFGKPFVDIGGALGVKSY